MLFCVFGLWAVGQAMLQCVYYLSLFEIKACLLMAG